MNILLLLRALGFGGTERQVIELAHGLARRGHHVGVATFYAGGPFEDAFAGPNPRRIVIGKRDRWDVVGFGWRLVRSVAAERPDVVYSFLPVPNLVASALRLTLRHPPAVVWGLRGTPLDRARYDRLERAAIRLERLTSRLPDLVIANSQQGAAWARGPEFGARKTIAIANGIDAARFRPAIAGEREAARGELGCPRGALVVAVVARLDPMKDHRTFLRALAIAGRGMPDLTALIVGDGPLLPRLKAEAAALGVADRVIWAPARREVTRIYHAADVLCLPSAFGEGFPNVVGEAMACGLPCIVTAVGDAAELAGDTGRVVSPRNPQEMARAILDFVKPLRETRPYNSAARQRIVENFSVETMISATERALLEVVAGRGNVVRVTSAEA